ncbi:MAG TPA: endolytic transglycosylase MltG [Tahibacter sp.]|uniref:endolytic transglycosylase MltG n=1 Tax=Tahibacter sp. TaxID=2056211 RepID=UPI002C15E4A6|nr:endolytic transglycosylase MltG [Tahibacter sp.]HSX61445.1 endolytic transglycosylase MltG [Tahibacter sp.]
MAKGKPKKAKAASRKPKRGGGLRAFFALLLIALAAGGWWVWRDWTAFVDTPLRVGEAAVLDVPSGASFAAIRRQIRDAGFSDAHDLYWRALAQRMGVASRLRAGEYAVPPGTTPRELLRRMAAGDVIRHRFTIVEGWTFRQLRSALAAETGVRQSLATLSDAEIMRKLGAGADHPEGRFLPETYLWTRGDSDVDLLRQAHEAMTRALDQAWTARAPDLPLESAYQALILASIVERETGKADERPAIAGVFVRRLRLGMKLQTDPTVIYGLGSSFDGNLRRRDLDTDTPYNTYTRVGLPPTPIALPGAAALRAAVQPAPGDALYFVARGDGSHEFSANLDAHNRAVARYQLRRTP